MFFLVGLSKTHNTFPIFAAGGPKKNTSYSVHIKPVADGFNLFETYQSNRIISPETRGKDLFPPKTNGWNLKIHPKGKGETFTNQTTNLGVQNDNSRGEKKSLKFHHHLKSRGPNLQHSSLQFLRGNLSTLCPGGGFRKNVPKH